MMQANDTMKQLSRLEYVKTKHEMDKKYPQMKTIAHMQTNNAGTFTQPSIQQQKMNASL